MIKNTISRRIFKDNITKLYRVKENEENNVWMDASYYYNSF